MVEPSKTERKEEGKAWEAAEMAEGRDSSQVATPADRAVSHTQVMAGQPSLAIVPHSHFITILLLQQVPSKIFGHGLTTLDFSLSRI